MFLALIAHLALACMPTDVPTLAAYALDGDEYAVQELRDGGPDTFDELLALRRALSSVPPALDPDPSPLHPQDPRAASWEALLDRVARQRYASASGLYWYTDLEAAKARARQLGRPILSLRLLGDLDEDLSCANSRFFRTLLYPDPLVSAAMREGWVLHWQSVRKAPRIDIDFGDGRRLTRTITGNSMHLALTPDGAVLDILPGLVGPAYFRAFLDETRALAARVAALPAEARPGALVLHHQAALDQRLHRWRAALRDLGPRPGATLDELAAQTTDAVLAQLASTRRVELSDEAAQLVRMMTLTDPGDPRDTSLAADAMRLSVRKSAVEVPALRQLRPVLANLAPDEVQNDLVVRSRLHTLLAERAGAAVDALVTEIYASVFATPLDDPWMGLASDRDFSGLPATLERRGPTTGAR